MTQYVILMGNPADGFVVIGPFADRDKAIAYMESEPSSSESMWIVELQEPAP